MLLKHGNCFGALALPLALGHGAFLQHNHSDRIQYCIQTLYLQDNNIQISLTEN
ncbi:MAG: hypothetical protein IPH93_07070 [Saprospiraceae bacterium]|nr:hypothetical protein [Saprospiraceae bacterium]